MKAPVKTPFSSRLGFALDKALSVIAPSLGLSRFNARQQLGARMYAAARSTEDAGGWMPYDGDANSLIRSSSRQVRARVRQLVRDFPYARRARDIRGAMIIGKGIRMQARAKDASGMFDKEANKIIESEYADWAQKADITGRYSFAQLQTLSEYQYFECGEYFYIKRYLLREKHPLRLQPIESDRLPYSNYGANVSPGCEVESGIEYDKKTGRRVAYHFEDDGYARKIIRVPADLVIHGYQVERPGQMRGISPLAPAVLTAGDLADLLESELESYRMAAKYTGFVTSNDPSGFQSGGPGKKGKNGGKVEYIQPGTLQYLRQGDEITLARIDRQGVTFEPFLKFNLRTLSVVSLVSYEMLSNDYGEVSWATLKGSKQDQSTLIRADQYKHIDWLCRPTSADWFQTALLTNKHLMPYLGRLTPACYGWIPPGMESSERLKDANAASLEMGMGTNSPQRICSGQGMVFEEILDELADAKQAAEERGLTLGEVTAHLKTNPAALMDDEKKE